jgi:hypothetical protein
MLNHLVSVDVYPVVTEETTVWKCKTVVVDDDGRTRILAANSDESFPTDQAAIHAALEAVRRFDESHPARSAGHRA